ncbi:MAG: hypothetical protein V7K43_17445 [Nostoc sp.]
MNSTQRKDEFVLLKNNWKLEKLYVSLISAKWKALTSVENKFLRGLLCGYITAEIAHVADKNLSSNTV